MTAHKTTQEKIQMLFFKALQEEAGRGFKPSDVAVTIEGPNVDDTVFPYRLTVDLSKATEAMPWLRKLRIFFHDAIGPARADERGVFAMKLDEISLQRLQNYPLRALYEDFASAIEQHHSSGLQADQAEAIRARFMARHESALGARR